MQIPYHRLPLRDYQKEIVFNYNDPTIEELLLIIARRGGKTTTVFSECVVPDLVKEVQTIVLVYPTAKMGFRNFWNNIENDGFKTIEHIPASLVFRQSNTEDDMRIELINGSVFMCVGATNTEALRGANGKKYIFDEFADQPIEAVNVVAPIIEANGGKLIYMGTPKIDGINGETMRRMHERFKKDDNKYTCYIDAHHYMTDEALEKVRQNYILRNGNDFKYRQEMLLDWGQSSSSSYYGEIMSRKDKNKSIGEFPYNPAYPVFTAWDLGKADAMVVLFFQYFKGLPRIIDRIAINGSNIKAMAKQIKAKPYVYGWHFLPHDGTVASLNDGVNRLATLAECGITNASTLKRQGISIGTGYVEEWLPKILINTGTTGDFHRKIRLYKKKFNPTTGDYIGAQHDSNSHDADALRYLATALHFFWNEKGEFILTLDNDQGEYESDLVTVPFVSV
jgi:phage terminase large subunit